MVLKPNKLDSQDQNFYFHYENVVTRNLAAEKILAKLYFKSRVINICTVVNRKLSAICRISNYIDSDKCKLLVNVFFKRQFSYCPLTWLFYIR